MKKRWRWSFAIMVLLFVVSAVATGSFSDSLIPKEWRGTEANAAKEALASEKNSETPSETPESTQAAAPSEVPESTPTSAPSEIPEATPAAVPSEIPEATPTAAPTATPTAAPTATPTAVPTVTPVPTAVPTATPAPAFDYVVSNVTEYVNIREEATTDSDALGKLYRASYAEILERGEEWTRIRSGSVSGYVKNEYLLFDDAAIARLQASEAILIEVTAGTVNIRTAPGTDSEIIREAVKSETFVAEPRQHETEWMAVQYEGSTAYLSAQYVTQKITYSTAVSREEEKAAEEAAALAKALEEAKKYTPSATTRDAVTLDDEDLFLLSIVVEMEASGESYQGKLAVANVVINRLVSGLWGDTLSSVVYAPNQFSGANSGRIETYSTRVSQDSKKAAVAAAAGENNIGDYMYFRMHSSTDYSAYSKYYILGNHIFYAR